MINTTVLALQDSIGKVLHVLHSYTGKKSPTKSCGVKPGSGGVGRCADCGRPDAWPFRVGDAERLLCSWCFGTRHPARPEATADMRAALERRDPEAIAEFWRDVDHIRAEQGDPFTEHLNRELEICERELERLLQAWREAKRLRQWNLAETVKENLSWVQRHAGQVQIPLQRRIRSDE
jgi:hypothetical protein